MEKNNELTIDEIDYMSTLDGEELLSYLKVHRPISEETIEHINKLKYFVVHDLNLLGKQEKGINYLYKENEWQVDEKNIISDRLMGYDESESEDSPYRMGNTDIMSKINFISEKEAKELMK